MLYSTRTPNNGNPAVTQHTGSNPYRSTIRPTSGELTACITAYAAVKLATANPARPAPNKSSGNAYTFTLKINEPKKLPPIITAAHPALGISGTDAVANPSTTAPTSAARRRAAAAAIPFFIHRNASPPPINPPPTANTGGSQAHSTVPHVFTRNAVVHELHNAYAVIPNPFAANTPQYAFFRSSVPTASGTRVTTCSGAPLVTIHINGIHKKPSNPGPKKACRQPKYCVAQLIHNGAKIIPNEMPI